VAWTKSQRDWCLRPRGQNQTPKGSAFKVLFAIDIFGLVVPQKCMCFVLGWLHCQLVSKKFLSGCNNYKQEYYYQKGYFHPLEDINIKKILHSEEPETFEYFI